MPVCVEHETSVAELRNECVPSLEASVVYCDVVPSVAADHQPSSSILHSLQFVDQAIRDAM